MKNNNRIRNIIVFLVLLFIIISLSTIFIFSFAVKYDNYDIVNSFITCVIGILLPFESALIIELRDTMPWQNYLRFLIKKKQITWNTKIRNSYAYGFSIKVDDKYFLILNPHGFERYQTPAHTYRLSKEEKHYLQKHYHIVDDDKISVNRINDDYRLFVSAKYLTKFYKRFLYNIDKQKSEDIVTGFQETLINTGYLPKELFKDIKLCKYKRVFTRVRWSRWFQNWEFNVFDVYECVLNEEQLNFLRMLKNKKDKRYLFADDKRIRANGIDYSAKCYTSNILENTVYILPLSEDDHIEDIYEKIIMEDYN